MGDTTRRDALARSIAARLLICDEAELDALDRMLVAIEKRRELVPAEKRTSWPPRISARAERALREGVRERVELLEKGLRELRDAATYTPRRPFEVIQGGLDERVTEAPHRAGAVSRALSGEGDPQS